MSSRRTCLVFCRDLRGSIDISAIAQVVVHIDIEQAPCMQDLNFRVFPEKLVSCQQPQKITLELFVIAPFCLANGLGHAHLCFELLWAQDEAIEAKSTIVRLTEQTMM